MQATRRRVLKLGGGVAITALCGLGALYVPLARAAESRPAFLATGLADALKALGVADAKASNDIAIKAPDIAENGAVVPIEVESKIAGTRIIAVLVEKNPHVMSAEFTIPEGTEPFVGMRAKVAESSNIHVVVKTDNGTFTASRLVKVTLGGCGG